MALFLTLFLLAGVPELVLSANDLASYVLTNTGSENGGNTFPGVSEPFGMIKIGPDLFTGSDSYSGYQPSGVFTGFSMLHESGTGGAPKYGVVAQMPVVGNVSNPLDDHASGRLQPDETVVGRYRSFLKSGVVVELGATTRAGMFNYTFPSTDEQNNVIVDVSHVLPSFRGMGLGQNYLGGNLSVKQEQGQLKYWGSGSYDNGWNRAPKWTVHFCGYFDSAGSYKTFLGSDATGKTLTKYSTDDSVASTSRLGAVFSFDADSVISRVGVSFISADQACENVDKQIPKGTTSVQLTDTTRKHWTEQVLSRVTTTDTNLENLQRLYTSIYFMSLIPTNKTGENPLWKSSEPYYDDIFTLWDTFRCTTSLFHILQPEVYEEYIRSLIDVWRHDGYMPDGRSSLANGATQGGSNADNVLADAYVKGVRGQVNWDDGYAAMVKDAEVTPPNNNDPRDKTGSTKEGRGALPDWLKYGYITPRYARSVSRAVEYSANDFGLYQVAKGLNKCADAKKYRDRSRNWRNHWNPNATSLGFSGFVVPRNESGFIDQDPKSCGGCYWGDDYYQALPWEYSFNAHHDIKKLIELAGGKDTFVDRLEMMFKPGVGGYNSDTLFNPSNEPSFTTPYLYNFVGRQDLSVKHSRAVVKDKYHPTPAGLPGNSDAGSMESWQLWALLGLYPITGQTTFLIGSPWFSNLTIALDGSGAKKLHITTTGGSDTAYYVQTLKVNGKNWDKSWVTYDDIFAQGGSLEFVLGQTPTIWATGPAPPSPATEKA